MIAYLLALTFTPCPRPIDAPPIRLTIINTQVPGIECARRAATPIDAAILMTAAGWRKDAGRSARTRSTACVAAVAACAVYD